MTAAVAEHDYEAFAVGILKASSEVTDLVAEGMISTKVRRAWKPLEGSALRVVRVGGLPTEDVVGHLNRARIQIDGFSASSETAYRMVTTAVAVLRNEGPGDYPLLGLVVTHVGQDFPTRRLDDPDTDAERYVAGVVIYGHGRPAVD